MSDFKWAPQRVPKIRDCIAYIKSCGCEFLRYHRWTRSYGFSRGGREFWFTLHEIRDAYNNGW